MCSTLFMCILLNFTQSTFNDHQRGGLDLGGASKNESYKCLFNSAANPFHVCFFRADRASRAGCNPVSLLECVTLLVRDDLDEQRQGLTGCRSGGNTFGWRRCLEPAESLAAVIRWWVRWGRCHDKTLQMAHICLSNKPQQYPGATDIYCITLLTSITIVICQSDGLSVSKVIGLLHVSRCHQCLFVHLRLYKDILFCILYDVVMMIIFQLLVLAAFDCTIADNKSL